MDLWRPGEGWRAHGRRWMVVLGIVLWFGGIGLVDAQEFQVSAVENLSVRIGLSSERNYYNPQWAPDGRRISFETIVEKQRQLYVYDLDSLERSTPPRKIVSREERLDTYDPAGPVSSRRRPSVNFDLSWRPKPTTEIYYDFAFVGSGAQGVLGLYLYDYDEKGEKAPLHPVAEANEEAPRIQFPDWHPKGKNIVYCRGLEGNLEMREVHYMSSLSRWDEKALVTEEDMVEVEPEYSPVTGDKIVFTGSVGGNNDIYVFDKKRFDEKQFHRQQKLLAQLTTSNSVEFRPRWSPDEQYIAFLSKASTDAPRSLWIMDAQGRDKPRKLADKVFENPYFQGLTWHPDGKHLFFIKASKEQYDPICYVNIYTGKDHTLEMDLRTQGNEDVAISPDGSQILFCARGDAASDRLTWLALYIGRLKYGEGKE